MVPSKLEQQATEKALAQLTPAQRARFHDSAARERGKTPEPSADAFKQSSRSVRNLRVVGRFTLALGAIGLLTAMLLFENSRSDGMGHLPGSAAVFAYAMLIISAICHTGAALVLAIIDSRN